jgi:hypothetical protein
VPPILANTSTAPSRRRHHAKVAKQIAKEIVPHEAYIVANARKLNGSALRAIQNLEEKQRDRSRDSTTLKDFLEPSPMT